MKVFKWLFAIVGGLYAGLLVSALAEGLYMGGYFIVLVFGSIFFIPLALLSLVPVIYIFKHNLEIKVNRQLLITFSLSLISGFLGGNVSYPILDYINEINNLPISIFVLVVIISLSHLIVVRAYCFLIRRDFSTKKVFVSFGIMSLSIFLIFFISSLPHLTQKCFSISVGDSREEVVEVLRPFEKRDLNSGYPENYEELKETEGNFFIHDRGVFCTVIFKDNSVTESYIVQDGP